MTNTVFYKAKKPVISIPLDGSLSVALSAVSCLPSHTLIRKLFKLYLYISIVFQYYFTHKPPSNDSLEPVLRKWIEEIPSKISKERLFPVFIWSLVDGRQRYYVHLLDYNGDKKFFGKITVKRDDYALLNNEKRKLSKFSNANTFKVPTVILYEENDDYCSLVTSYLSVTYSLYHPDSHDFPDPIFQEITQEHHNISYKEIQALSWWQETDNLLKNSLFYDFLHDVDLMNSYTVSTIHGDFGSENIFINNTSNFYIIDWERSTDTAPYQTDMVAFWLGKRHVLIKNNPTAAYKEFKKHFANYNEIDIALALVFLVSVNFDLAIKIIEEWDK